MKPILAIGSIVFSGSILCAQTMNVRGKVSNDAGLPVPNALVELMQKGLRETTGSDGTYSIIYPGVSIRTSTEMPKKKLLPQAKPGVYYRYITGKNFTISSPRSAGGILAKIAATVDTLKVSATGYKVKKVALSSYDMTANVTLDPDATVVFNPCPKNGSACKILPFGDSITRGAKSSNEGGYRSPLYALILAGKQKAVFTGSQSHGPSQVSGQTFPRSHEGHAGWTIDPGFNMISSSYSGISKLVPSPALDGNPNIILLMIGTNDLFARETANMAVRLEALLDKIVLNAPNALIVLAQLTPLGHNDPNLTAYNAKIPGMVQARAAKGQHIIGVDMSKLPVTDLSDGTHPNDRGYAYMADVWYAAIKDLLPN
jgi:lysophospholipase L1-like esterase